jgi:hypothetical protein
MDRTYLSAAAAMLHHAWRRSFVPLLLLVLLWAPAAQAQDHVMVYGTVKDMSTSKKLDGVTVTVFKNGSKLRDVITNASGKYEVNLDYGADYKIMCSKAGFVGKNITIDTRNVPEEERLGGHGMNIDFTLMAELSGVDYSILQQPFGKAAYTKASGNFEWDMEYTMRMRDAQAKLLKEYEERKKREAGLEAEYQKQMAAGEAALKASDFKKAVAAFTAALEAKPKDPPATAKLSDAQMRLDEQEGTKKMQEEYNALIKEADGLFSKKEYEGAKNKYTDALKLRDETHPKNRIKEIDVILAELAKKAEEEKKAREQQEKYDAAIKAADAAFNEGKWDQAEARYTEALGIKAQEKYPKDQLAAIVKKRDEERQAKDQQAKYDAAIAAGDAAFKASNWDQAEAKYNEALGIKAQEKYPKDQLAAVAQKREEERKKAEDEKQAAELKAKYDAAIAAADAAFQAKNWDQAEAKYNEALGHKPQEKYPKDQLAAVARNREDERKKADEEQRARELQEKYDAAIAAADAAFNASNWDQAEAKYNEALGHKAQEKYPKDQLAAVAKRREEERRKAEEERQAKDLQERYDAAIAAGDAAFGRSDWNEAETRYTDALKLKAQEKYPKDQLVAIAQRKAEEAKRAEEEKRRREEDARYNELIAKADKAFDKGDWSAAINNYKDASRVKPDESYPKDRIAACEREMDAAAAARAEADRMVREAQERTKLYNDLVAAADKEFTAKRYDQAEAKYREALDIKPSERHPTDRLAEIQSIRDALAAADAEAARRAAEEKARREEEEQRRLAEAEAKEARYKAFIDLADKDVTEEDFDGARANYTEALAIKPAEKYPKDRLAWIDAELKRRAKDAEDAERLAAEQRRREEERRRREREAAEAAEAQRLAEIAAREREEEERRRREREAEEARLAEEERLRQERDAARALDERYTNAILSADQAFAEKNYLRARGLYSEAIDLKPAEAYPKTRIGQIDLILEDLERKQREAELAAQRTSQRLNERPRSSSIDSRKEMEAEQFMREARAREEAEKYERLRKFRSDLEAEEQARMSASEDRRQSERRTSGSYEEGRASLYQGDDTRRARTAEELGAYRSALERTETQRVDRAQHERQQEYLGGRTQEERTATLDRTMEQRRAAAVTQQQREANAVITAEANRQRTDIQQGQRAYQESLAQAERQARIQDRAASGTEALRADVEAAKRAQQAREAGYVQNSERVRQDAREKLFAQDSGEPRSSGNLNRSQLARDYPQGVTEESLTEGNKVIIRRVVVRGDRADEYSKVIAKWGTFYFKNGHSISEIIWSQETE